MIELCEPRDGDGGVMPTGVRTGANLTMSRKGGTRGVVGDRTSGSNISRLSNDKSQLVAYRTLV